MLETGKKSQKSGLEAAGIKKVKEAHWNLSQSELIEEALKNREGHLADTGALTCDTGKFTAPQKTDSLLRMT